MEDTKIIDVYNSASSQQKESFNDNLQTKLMVDKEYTKIIKDLEWIDKIELTLPYIDNILRNANRFIMNDEEIVKIELARKITVESIKHLSKNTNFIQEINEKTGDVRPAKILNINKEENYDTYENRLIYTLIQKTKFFLNKKKKVIENLNEELQKDNLVFNYGGMTSILNQKVSINLKIQSESSIQQENNKETVLKRIEKLENDLSMLTYADVYKLIDKKHITLIAPPIRKTNVILKNVNFQYAMKLWDFLQENLDDYTKIVTDNKSYEDDSSQKALMDETFFLQSLIMKGEKLDDLEAFKEKEEIHIITDKIIEKLIRINSSLSEKQLKEIIKKKFAIIKYQEIVTAREIEKIFKYKINNYIKKCKGENVC